MENRNYYASVGLFTIAIILMTLFSIYWLSHYNKYDDGPMEELIVRIPGTVDGLSINSSVHFNGIPVGNVIGLFIDNNNPTYSIAKIIMRSDIPIYHSTKATIRVRGLTGISYIELSTQKKEKKTIFQIAKEKNELAVINAMPSGMYNLISTADNTLNKINISSNKIHTLINNIEEPITQTIKNFEKISQILANNISNIDQIIDKKGNFSDNFKNLINKTSNIITTIDEILKSIDMKKINNIIGNVQITSNNLLGASNKASNVMEGLEETTNTFKGIGEKADEVVSGISSKINSKEVSSSVNNIIESTSNILKSTSNIRDITDENRQKIITAMNNVTSMTDRLNQFSIQLTSIISKIKDLSGSEESENLIEQMQQTMKSFKNTADQLNNYIPPIANNVQNFSNSGLNDLQILIKTLQENVNHFDNFLNKIEQNPRDILWGTESAKEYKPKH